MFIDLAPAVLKNFRRCTRIEIKLIEAVLPGA